MTEPLTSQTFDAPKADPLQKLRDHYDYEKLKSEDMIEVIQPILRAGYNFNMEGQLEAPKKIMATNTPWVFARQDANRHCEIWHKIWFGILGLLPSPCLECWKVVVRPKSLRDLFNLRDIQVEMDVPSKCGIEIRDTVFGHYGGYFYTDSYAQGVIRWAEVRQAVDARMDENTPVILKRGCTEFEAKFGDSSKWDEHVTDEQRQLEAYLLTLMPYENNPPQMDMIKPNVMRRWIEFAWDRADPTVYEFTRGEPIHPPYTKYHDDYDASDIKRLLGPEHQG